MKLSEFKKHLQAAPDHGLRFALPTATLIESHAHVTEVGRIEKSFIDCGGTVRKSVHCSLQVWVADDVEHRLSPARLSSIIDMAFPILGKQDLDVEIEFQDGLISQYPVESVTAYKGVLLFQLTSKNTDCLAKELCGVPAATSGCGDSGCC